MSGRMERPSQTAQLTSIGRDKPAEERLLKAILDHYAKAPPAPELVSAETVTEEVEVTTTQPN
jgi:hypothetical protein